MTRVLTLFLGVCLAAPMAVAAVPAAPPPLSAQAARERLIAAVASARAGDAEPAAEVFRDLAERAPTSLAAIARYNLATLALAADEPERGPIDLNPAGRLRAVDLSAMDARLRRDARFNLAHALLPDESTPTPAGGDAIAQIDAKIGAFAEAAEVFRSCLDLDPDDAPAARNAERLWRRIGQLRQQKEAIERQRELARQISEALEQLAERQREEAGQPPTGPGEQGAGTEDQTSGASERLRQLAEQAAEAGDQRLSDAAARAAASAAEAEQSQQRAGRFAGAGDDASRRQQQEQAADALGTAAEQLRDAARGDQPQSGQQDGRGGESPNAQGRADQSSDAQPEGETADGTPDGDPIARMLLDKEQREREAREARPSRRGTRIPVEKDW